MTRSLAFRRHQEQRSKAKARATAQSIFAIKNPNAVQIGRLAHTPVNCSGPCCGNGRRHFGQMTMQELRAPQVACPDDQLVCAPA